MREEIVASQEVLLIRGNKTVETLRVEWKNSNFLDVKSDKGSVFNQSNKKGLTSSVDSGSSLRALR